MNTKELSKILGVDEEALIVAIDLLPDLKPDDNPDDVSKMLLDIIQDMYESGMLKLKTAGEKVLSDFTPQDLADILEIPVSLAQNILQAYIENIAPAIEENIENLVDFALNYLSHFDELPADCYEEQPVEHKIILSPKDIADIMDVTEKQALIFLTPQSLMATFGFKEKKAQFIIHAFQNGNPSGIMQCVSLLQVGTISQIDTNITFEDRVWIQFNIGNIFSNTELVSVFKQNNIEISNELASYIINDGGYGEKSRINTPEQIEFLLEDIGTDTKKFIQWYLALINEEVQTKLQQKFGG
jgi:hypothetical protein